MKTKKSTIIVVLILLVLPVALLGQTSHPYYPKIGDTVFQYVFDDVVNDRKKVSIDDYRGKWLILDFWSANCSSCIASFGKMDRIQQDFKDSVKLIMIGDYSGNNNDRDGRFRTKALYERNAKLLDLKFTVVFDSVLADRINVYGVPHILVVNPKGTIVAKTMNLDSADIVLLLRGSKPQLSYSYSLGETQYSIHNFQTPLLTKGIETNGGIDTGFFYRSMFKKWEEGLPDYLYYGFNGGMNNKFYSDKYPNRAELFGFDIPSMLRICYWGCSDFLYNQSIADSVYRNIIIETGNKEIFGEKNSYTYSNSYCYSLYGPIKDYNKAAEFLLSDLQRVFNFKSSLEDREVDVWQLIVIDINKVKRHKTKFAVQSQKPIGTFEGSEFRNFTPSDLIKLGIPAAALITKNKGHLLLSVPPVVDKTNIGYGLDIKIEAYRSDFSAVRKSLNRAGLDLVPGKHVFKCIVVRDI